MDYLNTFDPATTKISLDRLEKLTPDSQPQWGKMDVAQMIAHLNVAYDQAYGRLEAKYSGFAKFMLKLFVKKIVVSDTPYKKNNRTSPDFLITDTRDFNTEKAKLIENIKVTEQHGADYFSGKESAGFGPLTVKEWSNLFYKHMDHHFQQFGV